MLTHTQIEDTNIIDARYDGDLTGEGMDTLRDRIEAVTADKGSVRLLVQYDELGHVEPEAAWKDLRMSGKLSGIDKMALVTDQKWVGKLAGVADTFGIASIETFPASGREDALHWLRS